MTLVPAKLNFVIWKGATFREVLTLYTGDEDSPPRNLTGYTALLEIRDVPEAATPLLILDTNDGIILGDTAGTVTLLLDAATTAAITWKAGVYDLTLTAPNGGDTDAWLTGKFSVRGV